MREHFDDAYEAFRRLAARNEVVVRSEVMFSVRMIPGWYREHEIRCFPATLDVLAENNEGRVSVVAVIRPGVLGEPGHLVFKPSLECLPRDILGGQDPRSVLGAYQTPEDALEAVIQVLRVLLPQKGMPALFSQRRR